MTHVTMTPFGRQAITLVHLQGHILTEQAAPVASIDKWQLLRELTTARRAFGISDRDISVLSALISFHPARLLEDGSDLVVFPSNTVLSARAHGMPESTLRRHISALVRAGLLVRRDSPNGKRFARRATGQAFGFDLRPLLVRACDIQHAANAARAEELKLHHLRESIILKLRDASKLIAWGREHVEANWDMLTDAIALIQRGLRRRPQLDLLSELEREGTDLIKKIRSYIAHIAEEVIAIDVQNERHIQSSKEIILESEEQDSEIDDITLSDVLEATPEINSYCFDEIRTWRDLLQFADRSVSLLAIDRHTWQRACEKMGLLSAATTFACMLQNPQRIRNPAAYLNALSHKAAARDFSPVAMVRALLRRQPVDSCQLQKIVPS